MNLPSEYVTVGERCTWALDTVEREMRAFRNNNN